MGKINTSKIICHIFGRKQCKMCLRSIQTYTMRNTLTIYMKLVFILQQRIRCYVLLRACKSRARKRGWGRWGQEVHILYVNIHNFVLFLVVLIELFPNSVFQLYCPKDYYKQKQWSTLPVTMITEVINCNRVLWWFPLH